MTDDLASYSQELRSAAENYLRDKTGDSNDISNIPVEQLQAMVHELQVYKIELEMQNDELRKTQLELGESLNRYLDLYDYAPVGYLTVDSKGIIREINLTAARMLQVDRGNLVGVPFSRFVPKEYVDTFYVTFRRILETGHKDSCEIPIIRKDAGLFWVQFEGVAVPGPDGHISRSRVVLSDVSMHKLAQERLRNYRENMENAVEKRVFEFWSGQDRLALAIEGSEVGIWDWRVKTGEASFNERWAQILGYTLSELTPTDINTWVRLAHPEDIIVSNELLQKHFSGQSPNYECEARMRHKDGHWVWVLDRGKVTEWDIQGKPVRMTGTHLDITQRKLMEQALRDSEQRFRMLFEKHDAIMLLIEPQSGSIVEANHAASRFYGYSREDLCNFKIQDINCLSEEEVSRERQLATDEKRNFFVFPHRLSNGEIRTVEVHSSPIEYEGQTVLFSIVHDITDRKLAELNLKRHQDHLEELVRERSLELYQSEMKYRTVANFTYDWEYWVSPLGSLVFVSPAVEGITGYSADEFLGNPKLISDIVHPKDRENVIKHLENIDSGPAHLADFRIINRFGQEKWISHHCQPVYGENGEWLGRRVSNRDITDRKLAENALQDSENTLKTILSASPIGILLIENRKIVWVNDAILTMLGYDSNDELIGMETRRLYVDEEEYLRLGKIMYDGLEKARVSQVTGRYLRKDGSVIDASVRIKLVDPSAPRRLAISVVTDITEELRAEREKIALQAQYLQAQKMEAIGNLASGIYHDFNNLLQIVLGYADLILTDNGIREKTRNNVNTIVSAGERGADLIRNLLMFSRKGEVNFQPIDLNDQIEQVVRMLCRSIPQMIKIETNLALDLASINSDPTQMDQILINLAVNSADAMRDEGVLCFSTENVILDQEFCGSHLGVDPGPYVLLRVSDTGMGMDKTTLDHIFEPFFTTKGVGKGTGLGLATVYSIVRLHRGIISCESSPGHGTTFSIFLPALISLEAADASICRESCLEGGNETILVVDDDEILRGMIADMLGAVGYKVVTARNGLEALEKYRMGEPVDMVLLDIMMPDMGGQKCLEELLRINPGLKVLIATGVSPDDYRIRLAMKTGAIGVVHKPVKYNQLLLAIRNVMSQP